MVKIKEYSCVGNISESLINIHCMAYHDYNKLKSVSKESAGQELLYANNEVINKQEEIDGNRDGRCLITKTITITKTSWVVN